MSARPFVVVLLAAALLPGCATSPQGPTARVMPAPGKPFQVFQQDQEQCKQFADTETNGNALLSNAKQLGTAVVSTALGGVLGAALSHTRGAPIGGALGAIIGTGAGARGAAGDQMAMQSRYDLAYTQCMYSRGNQVPGVAHAAAGQPGRPGGQVFTR